MTVESQHDIEALKEIGRIVALTIQEMKRQARVGMTTKELDEIPRRKPSTTFPATRVSASTMKSRTAYRAIGKFGPAT